MRKQSLLNNALDSALERYAAIMGEPFPCVPIRNFIESESFEATATSNGETVKIRVSTGVVDTLTKLWQAAIELSNQLPEDKQLNVVRIDDTVNASLTWLMLHELHHFQIGHLELIGSAGISETSLATGLGLTSRSVSEPTILDEMDKEQALAIQRCWELQADHDSLDIMLDRYSTEGWGYIRFYMAACTAMIVLIDQQEEVETIHQTHPTSAARIFQLFGALATLWQPNSTSDWQPPSDEEIIAYHGAVVAPAVSDAIILAQAAGAISIVKSWDQVDDLFNDMRMLQEPHKHDLSKLQTAGAREYASLIPANQTAIELLGPEKFFR